MENRIYCTRCGAASDQGVAFCSSCGSRFIQPDGTADAPTGTSSDLHTDTANIAMQTPLPPVYPAVQPTSKNAGFMKGMLVGCLIPVVLFAILMLAGFFLFNTILSRFLTNLYPG